MSKRVYPVMVLFLVLLLPWSSVVAGQPPGDAVGQEPWREYQAPLNYPAVQPTAEATDANFDILIEKAKADGYVPIIVKLGTAFIPEGSLISMADVQSQRNAIARTQTTLLAQLSDSGAFNVKRFEYIPYMALIADEATLKILQSLPEVIGIEEDIATPVALAESIPLIDVDTVWDTGYSGAGWAVAILDSGVDKGHTFLSGKIIFEACYSTSSPLIGVSSLCPNGSEEQIGEGAGVNCPSNLPGCSHGTHVAGIAAGKGDSFSGVARDANVISIQVFSKQNNALVCSPNPAPCISSYSSDQIKALERVYTLHNIYNIAAVNMSLGGGRYTSPCDSEALKAAIDNLRVVGIATVIASGNDGYTDALNFPACISSAVSVGATTKSDSVATNYSNSASFLNLLAPGSSINSSVPGSDYGIMTGTSMAAPHVTGAWAVLKQRSRWNSVDHILAALESTGVLITDPRNNIIKPRIQVDQALEVLCPPLPGGVVLYKDIGYKCFEIANRGYMRQITTGWQNVSSAFNDQASSIRVPSGWSVRLYEHSDRSGGRACRNADDDSFLGDAFNNGVSLNNNISSFEIYDFPNCGVNNPPNTPSLQIPSNGSVVQDNLAPTLCWNNTGDPDGNGLEFYAEVYSSPVNANSGWIDNTCWRPEQLDGHYYTYYWRVKARDSVGEQSSWSNTWSFTIESPNRPPSIDFNTANDNIFPSGVIFSRDANWIFSGTASDPESALNRVEYRCSGDNCGAHHSQAGLGAWTYERRGLAGQNDIYFMAFDNAGNYNYSRHLDLRIDLAAPTTQASLNNEANTTNWPTWFTKPVAVRLAASDGSTARARAGVQDLRYRVDDGAWQTRSGETVAFTISSDGAHTVEYYAMDKVGNTESTRSVSFQIDQTPPSVPSGAVETHGVTHNVWQKAQNTPTFTWDASTDATSGVWGYQIYFGKDPNGIGYQTFRTSDPRQWTPQPGGVHTGVYYLRGHTRDHAGNWSAWTNLFTFRYDETPPENPDDVVHTAGITSTVWQRVTKTADFAWTTPHDEGSGVQGYYVYWGPNPEGTTNDFITPHSYQDSTPLCAVDAVCTGYLRLRSVDNVANVANEWSTGFVLRYDNVPPVVDFTFNNGMTTTDQTRVTLDIAASDEGSGVQALRLSPDGQTWLSWEVYTTTHEWFIPGISRQYWPVYVQVRDGVGLESAVVSHTVYLDVNRTQPRSANFRLFDHTLSAGAGAYTSTVYSGRGTAGQIIDGAVVTSTNFQVAWGYEAGSQALPLIIPGHDDFTYVNGIFASGTGATTLTSTHFSMLGTFNEIGLPNTTTLTSTTFTHQPGFLAAAPSVRPSEMLTQTVGPPPPPEPPLACETPYVLINEDAPFTEQLTITLNLCAPRGVEMQISNHMTFTGATWESYAITKTWVLSDTGPQTTARFVYVMFKDDKDTIHEAYFDDIIYDTSTPSMTILLGTDIPVDIEQANNRLLAEMTNAGVLYIETQVNGQSRWVPMLTANTEGTVPIYVGGTDANSGIAEMQFSDTVTFTDASWESYAPVKIYAPPGEDGLKTVYARARDGAGNVSPIITGTFLYDSHAPAGDMVFNAFAVRPDTITTTLYTGAWDNASGVGDVRIGANSTLADAAWEPYTYTLVVPLSLTTQSTLTMYAQYRDISGNLSVIYSDTLYVDGEPPVVYVDVSATELSTATDIITLPVRTVTIYAYDHLSGVANRYISNDPLMQEGLVTLPYTSTVVWIFNERRVAWVQVADSLGNVSSPYPVYVGESNVDNQVYLPLVIRQ